MSKTDLKKIIQDIKDPAAGLAIARLLQERLEEANKESRQEIYLIDLWFDNRELWARFSDGAARLIAEIVGRPPRHQWQDTRIRFELPDGTFGDWVDLQGPRGKGASSPGYAGQPIVNKIEAKQNGQRLTASLESIDFRSPIEASTTTPNEVRVEFLKWFKVDQNSDLQQYTGYIVESEIELTLPDQAAIGSMIKIMGVDKFNLKQRAGQKIIYGNLETTQGIGGELKALQVGSVLNIICIDEDRVFMIDSSIGNFEVT